MAFFYTEEQKALLCKLINEANPKLALEPRTLDNTRLGPPLVYAPQEGEIANTRIMAYSLPGHTFVGKQEFKYRRIRLDLLFNHMVLEFDHWLDQTTIDRTILCQWVNDRYQLNLVPEDLEDRTWPDGGGLHSVNVLSSSWNYQGQFFIRWDRNKRKLDQIFPSDVSSGRIWDTRHEGEIDERPLLTVSGFRGDYTTFLDHLEKISSGMSVDDIKDDLRPLVERYNALFGAQLDLDIPHTEINGLGGLTVLKSHLPSSLMPEADNEKFNKALTIPSKSDSWFGGSLYFHHNDFTITANRSVMGYGEDITFTIKQDHAQPGVMYFWTVEGSIFQEDLDELGRGSLFFNKQEESLTLSLDPYTNTERGGKFRLQLRRESENGPIIEVSDYITVRDPGGQVEFRTTGLNYWTVPEGVYEIDAVCVGGGGGGGGNAGSSGPGASGGGGGGLRWRNKIPVTPGDRLRIYVGVGGTGGWYNGSSGGQSSIILANGVKTLYANGGGAGIGNTTSHGGGGGGGGGMSGEGGNYGGGNGGSGGRAVRNGAGAGGGGAGGYAGRGGNANGGSGTGGGAGAGVAINSRAPNQYSNGAGTGIYGQGANGAGGTGSRLARPGSGGGYASTNRGGWPGGGGGGCEDDTRARGNYGGHGAVRIIWGYERAFPDTNTHDIDY